MAPPSSRRPSVRLKWGLAAAAAAIVLGGGAALSRLLSAPPDAKLAERAPASAGDAPEARASASPAPAAAAASAPAPPADERGYVRRLVVVAPPEPGQKPRDIRDASVVAQETAVEGPSAGATAASASLAPLGAPGGSAASAAFAAAGGPALVSAPGASAASPASNSARPAAGPAGRATRDAGSQARRAPKTSGSDTAALSAAASEASRLVARARGHLKTAGTPAAGPLTPAIVEENLRAQLAQDQRADASVRDALSSLPPDASEDQKEAAVANALQSSGEPSGPEDVAQAMAIASAPPQPQPSAEAMNAAMKQMTSNLPDDQTLQRLAKIAMEPEPKPTAPPPKGGVAAYLQYQDAFEAARATYGLTPAQLVPFPAIETSLGANTGKDPVRNVLMGIAQHGATRSKQAQASRDLAALYRLEATNQLGGRKIDQIYGSYAGAIGITQFLPSSWEAYGKAFKSGANKNPWDFRDAVTSTANYLERHGSRSNYDKAVLSYNYSQDYLNKIKQYGANVAPGIAAVKQAQAEGRLPPGGQAAAAPRSGAQ